MQEKTVLTEIKAASSASDRATGKGIRVENLNAYYGKHLAIKNVNITFEPNQITALIGPSGCGKSTLLRNLNRMHEEVPGGRAEGKIFLGDENILNRKTDPALLRQRIGMVFQKPNPFPALSIKENVLSGLRLVGEDNPYKLDRIAEESLKRAYIWDEVKDKLDEPGISLSGGQQQRLCIARTIAVEPEVILMDEPCSALDPISTLRIEELMLELKKRFTIVIVTHNMQQAARVSDKTAFMLAGAERTGEVVEFGDTKKMFTSPRDQRTEDYISGRFG
ncbi:MAG TPA: phosphate ABC transporter ATP-binding protein PstB [Chloroflexia bacterium]|nr:phosphate ABC transporter ATP-binding protein PstB [Chloroflexia bacterium]